MWSRGSSTVLLVLTLRFELQNHSKFICDSVTHYITLPKLPKEIERKETLLRPIFFSRCSLIALHSSFDKQFIRYNSMVVRILENLENLECTWNKKLVWKTWRTWNVPGIESPCS